MPSMAARRANEQAAPSTHSSIDAAIRHVLACYRDVAPDMPDVIAAILASRLYAEGPDAFGGSKLTGDGFPVEFAVSTADETLRVTVEAGARNLTTRQRLELAISLIGSIDANALGEETLALVRSIVQADSPPAYGAWIGLRFGGGARRAKLYAQIAPNADPGLLPLRLPRLPDRPAIPRMIGCSARGIELYLKLPSLLPAELAAVLEPAGLAKSAREVLDFIENLYSHEIRGRLPGPSVGVSFAQASGQVCVTLFFFARSLWGADSRIRQRFVQAAGVTWSGAHNYLEATAPIADREKWTTFHGLVGITLRTGAGPSLSIGFRPVSP